jgi:hypothetical protein
MPVIWGIQKAKYFFGQDWTAQITLNWLRKLVFGRNSFRGRHDKINRVFGNSPDF